jgi:hypothetical protein
VHNLGYAGPEREFYPWVAELSADDATFAAARRRRAGTDGTAGQDPASA